MYGKDANSVFLLVIFFDLTVIRRYDRAPMSAGLPKTVDVKKFADTKRHLQGVLKGSLCHRLGAAIDHFEDDIQVDLQFDRDAQNRRVISGEANTRVVVICQRCLETVQHSLHSDILLAAVEDEAQASLLPDALEPVLIDDEPVDLVQLIEDELLLALPPVITHTDCEVPLGAGKPVDDKPAGENPFAVLKNLKMSD